MLFLYLATSGRLSRGAGYVGGLATTIPFHGFPAQGWERFRLAPKRWDFGLRRNAGISACAETLGHFGLRQKAGAISAAPKR
jgi:hypothetical protein